MVVKSAISKSVSPTFTYWPSATRHFRIVPLRGASRPKDVSLVQLNQIVEFQTPSLPGRTVKARVTFISPNLDEQTHTSTVRVLLEHPELKIKNKSQATGHVELDAPEVLAVPRRAVLWPGNTPRVYVETAPGTYEPRAVKLGRTGDETYELLEGVAEGERVVTSGQLLVDGQAQLNRSAGH